MKDQIKQQLITIFDAAVKDVAGFNACYQSLTLGALADNNFQPDLIIAVGKAASGMCAGVLCALEASSSKTLCPALVVTKYQHTDPQLAKYQNVTVIESAHPVPDDNSLLAGQALLDAVQSLSENSQLLLLVSGGASSLAELLPEHTSLEQWQQLTNSMLSSGYNIGQINTVRKQTSLIKDGKLLANFKGSAVQVLAISDVEGDDISVIGSGIGDTKRLNCNANIHLIATNQVARDAAQRCAIDAGLCVISNTETMYKDVQQVSCDIASCLLNAQAGVYIFGGEPTVVLPENPGSGGRNQSLALSIAIAIKGTDNIHVLVAGTDGSDGPTDAAGGIINGHTITDINEAEKYLKSADAGSLLRELQAIYITGPTNTNVMDLVIAIIE
ncbi:MAG: glycerate 2-kinase [Oceanospirillaceae bacterium]